jgi:hypothetical protein
MYHHDPNINLALEIQAERVRAVQAVGQIQGDDSVSPVWPNAELPTRSLWGRLRRWWPAVAVLLIGLTLVLVAWGGSADGALIAWFG